MKDPCPLGVQNTLTVVSMLFKAEVQATEADTVRLHDDISSYTGRELQGAARGSELGAQGFAQKATSQNLRSVSAPVKRPSSHCIRLTCLHYSHAEIRFCIFGLLKKRHRDRPRERERDVRVCIHVNVHNTESTGRPPE